MITKVNNTISFLKNLWVETFLNKTDKVTDITDNSVLNGVAYGTAKVAQKALKDIAIVEAQKGIIWTGRLNCLVLHPVKVHSVHLLIFGSMQLLEQFIPQA